MKYDIVVLGYDRMQLLVKDVYAKLKVPYSICFPSIKNMGYKEIAKQYSNLGELYISGDHLGLILRQKCKMPVIPIKPYGFDVLNAIIEASKLDTEILFLEYYNNFKNFKDLPFNIKGLFFQGIDELHSILDLAHTKGRKAVVGSSMVCDNAEGYGIKGIFYYSSDVVKDAILTTANILSRRRKEKEVNFYLSTVINSVSTGILSINEKNMITAVNRSAEKLLGVTEKNLTNKKIDVVIDDGQILELIKSSKSILNHVMDKGGLELIMNFTPIEIDGGMRKGGLISIESADRIKDAEYEIRKKQYNHEYKAIFNFSHIKGTSTLIKNTIEIARKYSKSDSPVLIYGETGTGKELFAQSIHNSSHRSSGPFIGINCAAMPETLIESELFGYDEGAFTGGKRGGKQGLFEMAHEGTIFLDEIGELPLNLQAKLLRFLQLKEVMRLGGKKVIPVNVRVIAATNRDIWSMVLQGSFRQDLFYRISVLETKVPSLRERKEDLHILVDHIFRQKIDTEGYINIKNSINGLCNIIENYKWPGNVRQLENFLEKFIVLNENKFGDLFLVKANFLSLVNSLPCYDNEENLVPAQSYNILEYSYKDMEKMVIEETLRTVGGKKMDAAKALGISRATLWRKMKKGSKRDET